jgi:hypothetical protein
MADVRQQLAAISPAGSASGPGAGPAGGAECLVRVHAAARGEGGEEEEGAAQREPLLGGSKTY